MDTFPTSFAECMEQMAARQAMRPAPEGDAVERLQRMFVGPANDKGRQDGWVMPRAEWLALGAPRTAAEWAVVLAEKVAA